MGLHRYEGRTILAGRKLQRWPEFEDFPTRGRTSLGIVRFSPNLDILYFSQGRFSWAILWNENSSRTWYFDEFEAAGIRDILGLLEAVLMAYMPQNRTKLLLLRWG